MVSPYQTSAPGKTALAWLVIVLFSSALVSAQEQPLRAAFAQDNFVIRDAMIPMRDGVKLYTVIISPKKNTGAFPAILKRTPYNASGDLNSHASSRLEVSIGRQFLGDDYIYVVQDIRGRFKSEGEYFMYRAPRGAFNNTETDETTDAWDTVDWIVKNVASNGRVGIWGNSYPGWLTLAALRNPQTFVPSIMSAPDAAYNKQQHRVHHSAEHLTYIEFREDTPPQDGQ